MTINTNAPSTIAFTASNPDYSDQPTITIDGWTVVVTGVTDVGIGLRVTAPKGREVTNAGGYARPEQGASLSVQCKPPATIVTPANGLTAYADLVYTARYTPWERDPKHPNQQRRFWQQTVHHDSCRHAKSARPLTVFDRKELDAHGFDPFSRHGGSLSRYTGCKVCGTGIFTKDA